MGHNTQVRSVALVFLIIACWSSIPTASATLFPAINTLANEARDAVGAFGSLLNAIVLDPVRLATGSIQVLPRSIERFFDLPAISLASQRINDVTIDLTQLQVYAEDVLGIDNSCKPADYRAASRQPALIEGPTLSVTFNTVNCSIDGTDIGLLIDKHDKSKDIHINKTFACDKGLIEFEKTPFILAKSYHRAERYRCAECVISKEFGEEQEIVLFDGGESQVFESFVDFLAQVNVSSILPWDAGRIAWQVNAQLQQALSSPQAASLLATVLEVQQRVTGITDALLGGLNSKVNEPLEKLLDASLAVKVAALESIVGLKSKLG